MFLNYFLKIDHYLHFIHFIFFKISGSEIFPGAHIRSRLPPFPRIFLTMSDELECLEPEALAKWLRDKGLDEATTQKLEDLYKEL